MRVQDPQRHEHVGGDLGRPVRRQRFLGEQGRERPRRHQFTHYPQRTALGEHVEDLVQPRMVGNAGRGLRRLHRPPHDGVGGPPRPGPRTGPRTHAGTRAHTPCPRRPGPALPGREPLGQALRVEHLRLDDLRQRHLPDQDFLPAIGVEGPGLGEFVLVGRRQRQAVAVDQYPTREVVHVASPGRPVGQFRSCCVPLQPYPAVLPDAYGPQPLTIRAGGNPQRGDARSHAPNTASDGRYFFGVKVSASVVQVVARRSVPHAADFAVYINAYPRLSLTTNPRSIVRYAVPLSV
ncbi:hypothetical protein SAMN04487983_1018130 [Streptomyces sp. yr375]|nr:hypothetical protein SAMN04487983_1018130 [Streptomyces sp. yr375]